MKLGLLSATAITASRRCPSCTAHGASPPSSSGPRWCSSSWRSASPCSPRCSPKSGSASWRGCGSSAVACSAARSPGRFSLDGIRYARNCGPRTRHRRSEHAPHTPPVPRIRPARPGAAPGPRAAAGMGSPRRAPGGLPPRPRRGPDRRAGPLQAHPPRGRRRRPRDVRREDHLRGRQGVLPPGAVLLQGQLPESRDRPAGCRAHHRLDRLLLPQRPGRRARQGHGAPVRPEVNVALLTSARSWRGSGTSFANVARGLAQRGHTVRLCTAAPAVTTALVQQGLSVIELPIRHTGLREARALLRALRQLSADVLLADKPRDLRLGALASLAARFALVYRHNVNRERPPADPLLRLAHRRVRLTVFLTEFHRAQAQRSEEHTSELQSLAYLVCRLLLEKKKPNRRRSTDSTP